MNELCPHCYQPLDQHGSGCSLLPAAVFTLPTPTSHPCPYCDGVGYKFLYPTGHYNTAVKHEQCPMCLGIGQVVVYD